MIEISYSKKDKNIEKWEEKLLELVVGFKLIIDEKVEKLTLQEGDIQLEGEKAIQQFIDELEKEVTNWRTPRCGV